MYSFYKIVLIIAIILLIALLIFIGVALKSKSTQMWPPVVGDCPDYWEDTSGKGGNCVNVKNLGTCSSTNMNFSSPTFNGSTGNCSKYQWATNCGVSWDGITYGLINNPCDTGTATNLT
jgi:hypothetical protein